MKHPVTDCSSYVLKIADFQLIYSVIGFKLVIWYCLKNDIWSYLMNYMYIDENGASELLWNCQTLWCDLIFIQLQPAATITII